MHAETTYNMLATEESLCCTGKITIEYLSVTIIRRTNNPHNGPFTDLFRILKGNKIFLQTKQDLTL